MGANASKRLSKPQPGRPLQHPATCRATRRAALVRVRRCLKESREPALARARPRPRVACAAAAASRSFQALARRHATAQSAAGRQPHAPVTRAVRTLSPHDTRALRPVRWPHPRRAATRGALLLKTLPTGRLPRPARAHTLTTARPNGRATATRGVRLPASPPPATHRATRRPLT